MFPEATDKFIALMEQPQHSDLDAAIITLENLSFFYINKFEVSCQWGKT